mmetsp:Transcript_13622/g.15571  ORF Transcript_13622/g.15571 Transcript_13622/m.15571 type:complete len:132 (-) Transcript_13622:829-1224(-)
MDTSYQVTEGRLKWCVYFEPQEGDDTVEGIRKHLKYLKEWFAEHPSYARTPVDNKPVIFVYNRNKKEVEYDCHTIAKSWSEANAKLNQEWHIVLKLLCVSRFFMIYGCDDPTYSLSVHSTSTLVVQLICFV